MSRLEGPGSASRLSSIQARFRAVRARAERLSLFRSARPVVNEFGLFFVAFLAVGLLVWWLVS